MSRRPTTKSLAVGLLMFTAFLVIATLLIFQKDCINLNEHLAPPRALQETMSEPFILESHHIDLPHNDTVESSKPAAATSPLIPGKRDRHAWVDQLPPLYIVTPTYPRAEQMPELIRTAQTLMSVPNVMWIVSEDAAQETTSVKEYLHQSGLHYVYLLARMPVKYHKVKNKPRGVANRISGLEWVKKNAKFGVMYFADDDNTYDIRIFEQMRWTRKVSMFPVGLVTKLGVSTPIVRNGSVIGFYDGWVAKRKFPVDMAGFAVNVEFLLSRPAADMPYVVGYEEDGFMKSLAITVADIEPLADNCTKIMVWHTQTKKNDPAVPIAKNATSFGTNLEVLGNLLWKGPKL